MRSRADAAVATARDGAVRRGAELALRLLALGCLAAVLWRATRPAAARAVAPAEVSPPALAAWAAASPRGAPLDVALARAPDAPTRAWLAALARIGHPVRWRDAGVTALAAAAEPRIAPAGGSTLLAAAPAGTPLVVGDDGGTIDSVVAGRAGGVALDANGVAGRLAARAPGGRAVAALHAPARVGRVLVAGAAGWEAKFTIAALEEAGWVVDAVLDVAPGTRVGDAGARPDTARHAAVVLLDTTASRLGDAVARYVRAGGGAVLAGRAAASLPALRAGAPGRRLPGIAGAVAGAAPREGLGAWTVATLAPTAVALERRGAAVVAAARRVGPGRVVQLGYDETWRWRMEGADDAPDAHRRWWSAVVASVAYAPADLARPGDADSLDAAPRAALVAALGAPAAAPRDGVPAAPRRLPADSLLFATALVALLAEWASRRLRGAR